MHCNYLKGFARTGTVFGCLVRRFHILFQSNSSSSINKYVVQIANLQVLLKEDICRALRFTRISEQESYTMGNEFGPSSQSSWHQPASCNKSTRAPPHCHAHRCRRAHAMFVAGSPVKAWGLYSKHWRRPLVSGSGTITQQFRSLSIPV